MHQWRCFYLSERFQKKQMFCRAFSEPFCAFLRQKHLQFYPWFKFVHHVGVKCFSIEILIYCQNQRQLLSYLSVSDNWFRFRLSDNWFQLTSNIYLHSMSQMVAPVLGDRKLGKNPKIDEKWIKSRRPAWPVVGHQPASLISGKHLRWFVPQIGSSGLCLGLSLREEYLRALNKLHLCCAFYSGYFTTKQQQWEALLELFVDCRAKVKQYISVVCLERTFCGKGKNSVKCVHHVQKVFLTITDFFVSTSRSHCPSTSCAQKIGER